MKQQNQTRLPVGRKLGLNKKTISNLSEMEMIKRVGGMLTSPCNSWGCGNYSKGCNYTYKGKKCTF